MDLLSQWFDSLLNLPNEPLAAALAGLSFLLFAALAVSWSRAVQARRAARKTGNVTAFEKRQRHRTGKAQTRGPRWSRQLGPVSLIALAGVLALWSGIEGDRSGNSESSLRGLVTHVRDGDTIEVANVPVRIANLDCAEMSTAEGRLARERIAQLVRGQQLACDLEGRMSHDREVGTCALTSSGEDIGETLIREGMCGRW